MSGQARLFSSGRVMATQLALFDVFDASVAAALSFVDVFEKIAARKVGCSWQSGKTLPGDEFTFAGQWDGDRVVLRSRVRQIDARSTFHISSNQRLRTSGHTDAQFVDLEVREGALSDAQLEALRELAQAGDTRPVVIRRRGERVR